jgi:L-galactose dehydrogenase
MRYKRLGKTGLDVSVIGFGAAPLGNEFGPIDETEAERAVAFAIDHGINFFDTSPYYGRTLSETRLGKALAGRRNEIVLATKCGRYDVDQFDFSAARINLSVEESLRRLQTDHLDILTAHDIEFGDREQVIHETIPAMRRLQTQGKVRFVGVSGLPLKLLADVARRGGVDTLITYCHFNLMVRDLDQWLTPIAQAQGIGLINAAALHLRILTREGPTAKHPASAEVKAVGVKVVDQLIAAGLDPAVAAVAYSLTHPYSASMLVGMSKVEEVRDNLGALNVQIPPDVLAEIDSLVEPVKDKLWRSGRLENDDVQN